MEILYRKDDIDRSCLKRKEKKGKEGLSVFGNLSDSSMKKFEKFLKRYNEFLMIFCRGLQVN